MSEKCQNKVSLTIKKLKVKSQRYQISKIATCLWNLHWGSQGQWKWHDL